MSCRLLVSVTHEHGVAAVVRDQRGQAWLGDPEPGTRLEGFRPGVQGLATDVTLTGGLLPPGAVSAVVRDRAADERGAVCGDGAWLALLVEPVRGEPPLVRFLDAAGRLVVVPLAAGVQLKEVSDADEPCPVCHTADWARVVGCPPGRYGEDDKGRPAAAVCRSCGYEEALDALYAPMTDPPPEPSAPAGTGARDAREAAATARSVRLTCTDSRTTSRPWSGTEPMAGGWVRSRWPSAPKPVA